MVFLNDDNVDVYFSTWDRTIQTNKYLNYYIDEAVTINRIKTVLGGKVARGICLERYDMFAGKRYNSNMIHRWKRGLDMVRNSGVSYSHVCFIRPDLYFGNGFSLENILQVKDGEIAFGWQDTSKEALSDISMCGKYKTICAAIDSLSIEDWNISAIYDWHTYFGKEIRKLAVGISRLHDWHHAIICRPNFHIGSWGDVEASFKIWRDTMIIQQVNALGRAHLVQHWGEDEIIEIERKQSIAYYDQFKLP